MTIRIKKQTIRYYTVGILCVVFLLVLLILISRSTLPFNQAGRVDHSQHAVMNHPQVTNDKDFLFEMIPHHEEAVTTSYYIMKLTRNKSLQKFANDVVNVQSSEINQMKQWYKEWFGVEYKTNTNYKPMMRDLTALVNNVLDRAYVDDMIVHHEGAIMMAQQILEYTAREEIKDMAQNIITTQQKEITFLKNF